MREVLAGAEVGDDVFGDDPSVHALERYCADLLGKESAVFVTSGTQSNLCAVLAHCGRGDEYVVGENAHAYRYEAGGAAVLGSVQPQPVRMLADGSLDLEHVRAVVKPDDPHFARTRLLCVENTHDGKAQSVAQMETVAETGRSLGLGMHLDGARLWNAAAVQQRAPNELAAPFDTVSVCLSKGLGAPIGSVLVGDSAKIAEARKWRKMLGGGLRQAGIIAAAGLHALENHRDRVVQDHQNAALLAQLIGDIDGVEIAAQNTNMVFAKLPVTDDRQFVDQLAERNVRALSNNGSTRLVTHLGVEEADVRTAAQAMAEVLAS